MEIFRRSELLQTKGMISDSVPIFLCGKIRQDSPKASYLQRPDPFPKVLSMPDLFGLMVIAVPPFKLAFGSSLITKTWFAQDR